MAWEEVNQDIDEVLDDTDTSKKSMTFFGDVVSPAFNALTGGFSEAGQTYNRPLPSGAQPGALTKAARLYPFQPQGSTLYNMGGDVLGGLYSSGIVGGIQTAKYAGNKLMSPESRDIMSQGYEQVKAGLANPQNYISPALFTMATNAAKKGKQYFDMFMQSVPPDTAHTIRSTLNYMGLIPTIRAVGTAGEVVNIGRDVGNAAREAWAANPLVQESMAQRASSVVKTYTDQNVLGLAKGMSTPKDYKNLLGYMNYTMNDIVDNPGKLLRLDPETGTVSLPFERKSIGGITKEYSHLPQTAEDMSTAWQMRMDDIAGQINKRISRADQSGVSISLDSQIKALQDLKSKYERSLRGRDASAIRAIDREIDTLNGKLKTPGVDFADKPYTSIADAQASIEAMNAKLDNVFNTPGKTKWMHDPKAQILIVRADALRKDIDHMVDSLTGEGVADLKKQYKAYRRTLQAVNKQMTKAAGFKGDYVSELTNVVSGSMLVKAIAAGKLGIAATAITGREIAAVQRMMKDPNRRVRKAFEALAKSKRPKSYPSRSQYNTTLNPLKGIVP